MFIAHVCGIFVMVGKYLTDISKNVALFCPSTVHVCRTCLSHMKLARCSLFVYPNLSKYFRKLPKIAQIAYNKKMKKIG